MEDILGSLRRILSEEDEVAIPPPPGTGSKAAVPEILELAWVSVGPEKIAVSRRPERGVGLVPG